MDDPNELPTLPHDIIVDILTRLPVKSLLRLRCVCQGWNFLIQAPDFIKSHLERAVACMNENSNKRVLMSAMPVWFIRCENLDDLVDDDIDSCEKMMLVQSNPLESMDFDKDVTIVGSCNGLVCVSCLKSFFVWNPSTRVVVDVVKAGGGVQHPSWDCDYVYHYIYGFGYDSTIDDYKIVRVGFDESSGEARESEIEILTLGGGAWRKLDVRFPGERCKKVGLFANEALHWQHRTPGDSCLSTAIASFDLAKEKFEDGVLQLPDHDCHESCGSDLLVLGEKLALIVEQVECMDSGKFEIWVMEEYGVKESWTKKFNMTYPIFGYDIIPLCFSKNGSVLVAANDEMLMLYDPEYGSYRKLKVPYPWSEKWNAIHAIEYVESLVSPKCPRQDAELIIQN